MGITPLDITTTGKIATNMETYFPMALRVSVGKETNEAFIFLAGVDA